MNPCQTQVDCRTAQPSAELVVFRQQDTLYCVLLESEKPVEVIRQVQPSLSSDGQALVLNRHDLMLGRVRQVLPALNCAFVDIGDTHDALLPLAEAPENIRAGQSLILQISRKTPAHKGQRVTTQLALPGPYAVLLPQKAPRRRSKLRGLPEDSQARLFQRDHERLNRLWQDIQQGASAGPVPRCLYAFGDPCHAALISWAGPFLSRIRAEEKTLYQELYQLLSDLMPEYLSRLHWQRRQGDFGLAAILGLTNLEAQLQQRQVRLDRGGSIVIDSGEALTAVDVNSGHDTRGHDGRALRLRTNLQAAEAVARQLRLRNIGGMVVIDFLRMKKAEDRQLVDACLRQILVRDRARCKVYGFTAMGLFELVRTAV